MSERSGGCLCGKVRYTLSADPLFVALCHCRNCQKTAGSAFSVVALVPTAALAIAGAVTVYNDTGDSGASVERGFCGACGSPIVSNSAGMLARGMSALKAASFDDVSWLKPSVQIWCDSEQPWLAGIADVARVAKSPG